MMKRHIIYLFPIGVLMTLLSSCSGNGEPYFVNGNVKDYYLRVSPTTLSFTKDSGSKTISVTSNTEYWSISCNASWLTVSEDALAGGSGNGTIIVYASENPQTEIRTATITISSSWTDAVQIIVTQAAATEPGISFEKSSITFNDDGGEMKVKLYASKPWSINSSLDWLSISPKSGNGDATISLKVPENILTLSRDGQITAQMENKSATLNIKQDPMSFPLIYNTWTWDTAATDGAVWGNMGYRAGSGEEVGINSYGLWWGVTNEEGFLGQLQQNSDTGVATGEESMDAYMTFTTEGTVSSYDKNGIKIRSGNYYVERIDNDDWKKANLHIDEGSILWPFAINSDGYKPTLFEIVYITDEKMTLVYPNNGVYDSTGSWGEATFWHYAKKGTIENKPDEKDNQTPNAPARKINNK